MNYRHRQRGISAWLLMLLAAVAAVGGLVGLKLFPIYMESFKIEQAIESLVADPSVGAMSARDLRDKLRKRLEVDDVHAVNEGNMKELVVFDKKGDRVKITVNYRAETPLFLNLSMVATFHKEVSN